MDQKTQDLISEANSILSTLTSKNHLKYQVRTHIDSVCATGEGKEVLEHFISIYKSHKRKYVRNKYLTKLYYFQNIIVDANLIKYKYYSKCNRHKEWKPVLTVRFNGKQ
jgi:hypothetical protein